MTAIEMDAETARLNQEADNVEAANRLERAQERLETAHLYAQTAKAYREAKKAERERWWYPAIVGIALVGAGAALFGTAAKLLERPAPPAPAPQVIVVPVPTQPVAPR